MNIIGARNISYMVSGILVATSIVALLLWGLRLGIDFTGGSLLEVSYAGERPSNTAVKDLLTPLDLGEIQVQQTGEKGILVRTRDISQETHQRMLALLRGGNTDVAEQRFVSIGPVIGSELERKAMYALSLAIIMIVLYIAWAFRRVSQPVSSWKYGIVAILALVHDVTIPIGLFAYLGKFHGVEVNALFITALLTVLGFSVHDTIVIFDRIRENLKRRTSVDFEETVETSVQENITRSINTSLTLLLVLATLFFFGGESTKYFSLALFVGTVFGTYSSIFIASPLLVTWQRWKAKRT